MCQCKTVRLFSFTGRWESTKELIGIYHQEYQLTPHLASPWLRSSFFTRKKKKDGPLPNSSPTRIHLTLCKEGLKHRAVAREDDKWGGGHMSAATWG